jgi:putative oxidoreductase
MQIVSSSIELIGRICIAVIFIVSGINKIMTWDATIASMQSQGMLMYTQFFLAGAILVEILGGLFIALGYYTSFFASIVALYLIPVTYIFHHFWNISDASTKEMQMIEFMKNLAIFGGLLVLASTASGKFRIKS